MILDLLLATYAWLSYNANGTIIEQLGDYASNPWIPGVNASYLLNIDGLSMPLVFLTALLGVVAVLGSWHVKERVREYHVWLLLLLTGVQGRIRGGRPCSSSSCSGKWSWCRCISSLRCGAPATANTPR